MSILSRRSIQWSSVVLASALFAACGKSRPGNAAAYQEGSNQCSGVFIQDALEVAMEKMSLGSNPSSAEIDSYSEKLEALASKYRDVECEVNGKKGNVNEGMIEERAYVQELRAKAINQQGSSMQSSALRLVQPIESNTRIIFSIPSSVAMEFDELLKSKGLKIVQEGRIIESTPHDVDSSKPNCGLVSDAPNRSDSIVFNRWEIVSDRMILGKSQDGKTSMICFDPNGEKWSALKLQNVMKSLVEITLD